MNSYSKMTRAELISRLVALETGVQVRRSKARARLAYRLAESNRALRHEVALHQRDLATLRLSQQRQALILASLPMVIYTCSPVDGFDTTWVTPNSRRVTGFRAEQFQDVPDFWISRVHPEDRDWVIANLSQIREKRLLSFEYRWRCASEDYRWFINHAMLLAGRNGAAAEILGTWLDISDRKRLEREVLEVGERERRRIGRDLHDDLCQQLATIEFLSHALQTRLASLNKPASTRASEIARLARLAMDDARELARGLSPVDSEPEGLVNALHRLASRTEKHFQIMCRFRCRPHILTPDNESATHLYRIAQEAVANAIKHGRARRIDIGLSANQHHIVLTVRDDGRGLPRRPRRPGGMGLMTMRYRAGMMKGSLAVQPRNRAGTEVVCAIPLTAHPTAAPEEP